MKVQLCLVSEIIVAERHQLVPIAPRAYSRTPAGEPFVIDGPFTESKECCAPVAYLAGASARALDASERRSRIDRASLRAATLRSGTGRAEDGVRPARWQHARNAAQRRETDDIDRMHEFLHSIVMDHCE